MVKENITDIKLIDNNEDIETYEGIIKIKFKKIKIKNEYDIFHYKSLLNDKKIFYALEEEDNNIYIYYDFNENIDEFLNQNEHKEALIRGHCEPMSKKEIIELFEKENAICKIESQKINNNISKNIKGTGFFLELNIEDISFKKCLITNNHILNEDDIKLNEIIKFEYKNHTKRIKMKEGRKAYTNKELDYTCIEIFDEDKIEDFFKIDKLIINNSIEIYKNDDIFILGYPKGNELAFSDGTISGIKNNIMIHTCSTYVGSSGSPIISRYSDNSVIGLHSGTHEKYNFNLATSIISIITDIKNTDYMNNYLKSFSNQIFSTKKSYCYFHLKGLANLGRTCSLNSILQCLLHIDEFINYFLNIFPKDFGLLKEKNKNVETQGNISKTLYDLIIKLYNENDNKKEHKEFRFIEPREILKIIGEYNRYLFHGPYHYDMKDPKDYFDYILESIHNELNYFGDKVIISKVENQHNRAICLNNYVVEYYKNNGLNNYVLKYYKNNYSIISKLFSGIFEKIIKCKICQKIIYDYQSFYILKLNMNDYYGKDFHIYNGFEDNQKFKLLTQNNQISCKTCNHLNDLEYCSQIIIPPNILVISLGRLWRSDPKSIIFDEKIDITKYVNYNYGNKIQYRLFGVCRHFCPSGIDGHFIACCKNSNEGKWYNFNDAIAKLCDPPDLKWGKPYILFYERIN